MKIAKYKDFEIWYVSDREFNDVYWAEMGGLTVDLKFLDEYGKLIKANDLMHQKVEYGTLEELEDALSLYYGYRVDVDIMRTQKVVL